MTPEEQAALAQDPNPAAPAVASTPSTAAPAKAPWDADLAERFPDEATRSAVSAYLGEKVQPYVTQVEQSAASAQELLRDFQSAPKDTLLEIAQELLDEGAITAQDLAAWSSQDPAPEAQPPVEAQPEPQPQAELPQEVRELIDERREAREKAAFDAEYQRVKDANPALALDYDLYLQAVAETGDFDQAVVTYRERFGTYDEFLRSQQAPETPPAPEAPPVAGAEGGTGEVPTEPVDQTLHEAIDDFAADLAAQGKPVAPPAPPVAIG